jgi:putative peptidoglycan lipid II flippase
MSVSAAELPEMSSALGTVEETAATLRSRLETGLRRIAFFVIPSAVAFLAIGDVIAAALFQAGRFTAKDTLFTWGILAAASLGLLATSLARLYSSVFYALHDTKSPLRFALVRVVLAGTVGYLMAMHLPRVLGIEAQWGAAALALASSFAGWVELALLRSRLNARIGKTGVASGTLVSLLAAALVAAAAGFGIKILTLGMHRLIVAALVLGAFGILYFLLAHALGIPESSELLNRIRRPRRGRQAQ